MRAAMVRQVLDGQRHDGLELAELKTRINDTQKNVNGLRRDFVDGVETIAHQREILDRIGDRIGRIERRLDPTQTI